MEGEEEVVVSTGLTSSLCLPNGELGGEEGAGIGLGKLAGRVGGG